MSNRKECWWLPQRNSGHGKIPSFQWALCQSPYFFLWAPRKETTGDIYIIRSNHFRISNSVHSLPGGSMFLEAFAMESLMIRLWKHFHLIKTILNGDGSECSSLRRQLHLQLLVPEKFYGITLLFKIFFHTVPPTHLLQCFLRLKWDIKYPNRIEVAS